MCLDFVFSMICFLVLFLFLQIRVLFLFFIFFMDELGLLFLASLFSIISFNFRVPFFYYSGAGFRRFWYFLLFLLRVRFFF